MTAINTYSEPVLIKTLSTQSLLGDYQHPSNLTLLPASRLKSINIQAGQY